MPERIYTLGKAYGSTPSSPNWNNSADINDDDIVYAADLVLLNDNYGKKSLQQIMFWKFQSLPKTALNT